MSVPHVLTKEEEEKKQVISAKKIAEKEIKEVQKKINEAQAIINDMTKTTVDKEAATKAKEEAIKKKEAVSIILKITINKLKEIGKKKSVPPEMTHPTEPIPMTQPLMTPPEKKIKKNHNKNNDNFEHFEKKRREQGKHERKKHHSTKSKKRGKQHKSFQKKNEGNEFENLFEKKRGESSPFNILYSNDLLYKKEIKYEKEKGKNQKKSSKKEVQEKKYKKKPEHKSETKTEQKTEQKHENKKPSLFNNSISSNKKEKEEIKEEPPIEKKIESKPKNVLKSKKENTIEPILQTPKDKECMLVAYLEFLIRNHLPSMHTFVIKGYSTLRKKIQKNYVYLSFALKDNQQEKKLSLLLLTLLHYITKNKDESYLLLEIFTNKKYKWTSTLSVGQKEDLKLSLLKKIESSNELQSFIQQILSQYKSHFL